MKNSLLNKILDVSIALSAERNPDELLELILNVAMDVTNCDAGTLYIKEEEQLVFKTTFTRSMGDKVLNANLPPVSIQRSNVCACALLDNKIINLKDVYESEGYDFFGPKKYDKLTGYRTRSMLVIPMNNNKGECIGVLQLINALAETGEVIAFDEQCEMYISALSSQAAISLTNTNQQIEIEDLLLSLVKVLSAAIYERTAYNVTHTKNMSKYMSKFIEWLNENHSDYSFSENDKRQIDMSVLLHDVGKLTVPLEVMNKEDRLSGNLERILTRFEIIELSAKLDEALGKSEYKPIKDKLNYARDLIMKVNTISFVTEEQVQEIESIAKYTYVDVNKEKQYWLKEKEVEQLSIRKGTLTQDERAVIEQHVEATERILSQIKFGKEYSKVKKLASSHHEFLDGSGYPKGLKAKDLCKETRMLTIIDVFDGLSAIDRPYKKPIPIDRVFEILYNMADEGKIDREILTLFERSRAWEE